MAEISQQMAQGAPPEAPPAEQVGEAIGEEVVEQAGGGRGPDQIQGEEPTPEEQEQYTKYELAIKTIVHDDPDRFDKILEMIKASDPADPIKTLARVALHIFGVLDKDANIPEEYMLPVGELCLDYVIDIAEKTGIFEISEEMAEAALVEMIHLAGQEYGFDTTGIDEAVANGKANWQANQAGQQQPGAQQQPGQPPQGQPPAQPQQAAPQQAPPAGVV